MTTLMNANKSSLSDTSTNVAKTAQADLAWRELLGEALRRGFYGTALVEVNVHDGTIHQIRRRLERVER